jgi:hypothetical protein
VPRGNAVQPKTPAAKRPPHPATVSRSNAAQPKTAAAKRPPHPATVSRSSAAQPKTAAAKRPPHPATVSRSSAAQPKTAAAKRPPHPATVSRSSAAQLQPAIQRSLDQELEIDDVLEDDNEGPDFSEAMSSDAIFRLMITSEYEATMRTGQIQPTPHFWSPLLDYIRKYQQGAGGKQSISSKLVKIPLKGTYLDFLSAAAAKGALHPHNFGKAWKTYFGKYKKGKKGSAVLSIKNDGGTPTITFNKAPPKYLQDLLGTPEDV